MFGIQRSGTDNRASGPWRRRAILFSATLGIVICFIVVVAMTWAILYIHKDRSRMTRVAARIGSVAPSERSAFGRGIHFGAYSLTVRYRTQDGAEATDWLRQKTFGFPSKGDSITLLIDPESGRIETSPFPELWIILVAVASPLLRYGVISSRPGCSPPTMALPPPGRTAMVRLLPCGTTPRVEIS
jgi:hypothetical protein